MGKEFQGGCVLPVQVSKAHNLLAGQTSNLLGNYIVVKGSGAG